MAIAIHHLPAIASRIEGHIRNAYLCSHARIFWPEQFVASAVGTEDEIIKAFRLLEAAGVGKIVAEVACPNGHVLFEGHPAAVVSKSIRSCRYCDATFEEDEACVSLHLETIENWLDSIETTEIKK